MSDDLVVQTINAILNGEDNFILLLQRPQLERIRDEIVALRASLEHHDRLVITAVVVATPAIRAEALEEAARLCDRIGLDGFASDGAAAIRALKGEAR